MAGLLSNVDGVDIVNYGKLRLQRLLGRGSFAEAHLAHYDSPNVINPVVVKRIHKQVDVHAKRLFLKEAKLLSGLRHENVVRMYGICDGPLVIILEYMVFKFKPFQVQNTEPVSTVDKFLLEVSKLPISDTRFDHVIPVIAGDVAKGLAYLHNQEIAHRDLKPCNILISNQHYCDLSDDAEMKRRRSDIPVICKLADFGESRSNMLQTDRINNPSTENGWRGTVIFMAPEIFLPEKLHHGNKFSLQDLMRIDIWALGLVFYSLVNPSVFFPYARDANLRGVADLIMIHRQQKHPSGDPRYEHKRVTVWSYVHHAFQACTKHDPSKRLTASQALVVLHSDRPTGRYVIKERQPESLVRSDMQIHLENPCRRRPSLRYCRIHRKIEIDQPESSVQWYVGEKGEAALKFVFDELKSIADTEVTMSREKSTKDLSLRFERHGRSWQVKFPARFPSSQATVVKNGEEEVAIGGNTMEASIREIVSHIVRASQWYASSKGKAALKYVFHELTQMADSGVEIIRDIGTQDITFIFVRHGRMWRVQFSCYFPESYAKVTYEEDVYASVAGETLETAVREIKQRISTSDNAGAKTMFWKAVTRSSQ